MKCKNCGSEWQCAGNVVKCPFCAQDCTLPFAEIEALWSEAEAIPAASVKEKTEAYRRAAEYGYAPAQFALGMCYEDGTGVPRSPSYAVAYYRYSAEQGNAEAAYRLAMLLRKKYMGTPEVDRAYFWLRVAAELGVAAARRVLGDCYATGEGIPANPLRAAYWYTQACDGGDFLAAYQLAEMYHNGTGVRQNSAYEKYYAEIAYNGGIRAADKMIERLGGHVFSEVPARIEIKNRNEDRFELGYRAFGEGKYDVAALMYSLAARDGYAHAQNNLGVCFEKGQGVQQDEHAALLWYRYAAEGGYPMAWVNLGDCYRYGRGTEPDEKQAFACYLRAAEGGLARAQCQVANCYFEGKMTERDITEAMKWYEKAALQGYGEAVERINTIRAGRTEVYNNGVAAYEAGDYEKAVEYYSIAAACGHRGAQCNLGFCYQNGLGCEADVRTAVRYYRMAAEQDSGVAELNLALCYLHGTGGLPYSYRLADEYLRRAQKHGVEQAKELLDENNEKRKKKLARRVYASSAACLHRGDVDGALKLRLIAAELGNARAMGAVGCHYAFGFGVTQDDKLAEQWFRRAADAGFRHESKMKSALLKQMRRPSGFRKKEEEEI